jgi:hypothetical protein
VREPHLDLLAFAPRLLEALGASERPGNVPGVLMYVARDFARWFFWTALRFERAYIEVELACTIKKCLTDTSASSLWDTEFRCTPHSPSRWLNVPAKWKPNGCPRSKSLSRRLVPLLMTRISQA